MAWQFKRENFASLRLCVRLFRIPSRRDLPKQRAHAKAQRRKGKISATNVDIHPILFSSTFCRAFAGRIPFALPALSFLASGIAVAWQGTFRGTCISWLFFQ